MAEPSDPHDPGDPIDPIDPADPADPADPIDPIDGLLRERGARVAETTRSAFGSSDLVDLRRRGRRQRRVAVARLTGVTLAVLVLIGAGAAFSQTLTKRAALETAGSLPPTTVEPLCEGAACGSTTTVPVPVPAKNGTAGPHGTDPAITDGPTEVPPSTTTPDTSSPTTATTVPTTTTPIPGQPGPTTTSTTAPPSFVDCGMIEYASGWPTTMAPDPSQLRCIVDVFDAGTSGQLVTREQTDGEGGHILIKTYDVADHLLQLTTDATGAQPPADGVTVQICTGLTVEGVMALTPSGCEPT